MLINSDPCRLHTTTTSGKYDAADRAAGPRLGFKITADVTRGRATVSRLEVGEVPDTHDVQQTPPPGTVVVTAVALGS
jgi:hypothetical protein